MALRETTGHDDRRKEFRRPARKNVKIALVASADWRDCTVLDESACGVQVELSGGLPAVDEVNVALGADDVRLARIRWFRGTRAGLEFFQRPAADERDGTADCVVEIRLSDIEAGAAGIGFIGADGAVRRAGTLGLEPETGALSARALAYLPGAPGRRGDANGRVLTGAEACRLFEADFQ